MREQPTGDSADGALTGAAVRSLIAVLYAMLSSTQGIDSTLSRVSQRVCEEMATWAAFPNSDLTPRGAERERLWNAACATLYRVDAMRRLAVADRARLMILITALVNGLPPHYHRGEGRTAMYPADAEPLFKSPPPGKWDDDPDAGGSPGGSSAAGSSTQHGQPTVTRAQTRSQESGGGNPGKRPRRSTSRTHSGWTTAAAHVCAPAGGYG